MKRLTLTAPLILAFFALSTLPVFAQQAPAGQLYVIHEDVVTPAKAQKYWQAAMNLKTMLEENDVKSMSYQAASTNDFTYIYITPLNGVSDVENMNAGFGELQQKMGSDNFKATMDKFTDCYDSHRDYLIRLRSDLSYKPEYGRDLKDGMKYRMWHTYYIYPGKEAEMEQVAKKWVALHKKHDIEEGYRMYIGDMGSQMPMLIRVQSARDLAGLLTLNPNNSKEFGQEVQKLWAETWPLVRKYEQKLGQMRPDLSYQPKTLAAGAEEDTGEGNN